MQRENSKEPVVAIFGPTIRQLLRRYINGSTKLLLEMVRDGLDLVIDDYLRQGFYSFIVSFSGTGIWAAQILLEHPETKVCCTLPSQSSTDCLSPTALATWYAASERQICTRSDCIEQATHIISFHPEGTRNTELEQHAVRASIPFFRHDPMAMAAAVIRVDESIRQMIDSQETHI